MLARKNTLPVKEFSNVIKKGNNFRGQFFFIKTLENSVGRTRIGITVSKKLTKKATQRNYYKRVIRHVAKEALPPFEKNIDIVIIGQESIKKESFESLKKDAERIFKKAQIL